MCDAPKWENMNPAHKTPLHSRAELVGRGFGHSSVLDVNNFFVRLKDGSKIAIKVWFPIAQSSEANLVVEKWFGGAPYKIYCLEEKGDEATDFSRISLPCLLEYLPYRKSDWTSPSDHLRHPWLASHGFACVRADLRGSGESDGSLEDEYAEQELADGCEIIEWLSRQPWSNGRVATFGYSWGGFNGLQLSARRPPGLKAVISGYSTDNRFTDDIHYWGGCVIGNGMLAWASVMPVLGSLPPHPEFVPAWKEKWRKRLEADTSMHWAKLWLQHQEYDSYWRHGSVCESLSSSSSSSSSSSAAAAAVSVPTLLLGGWSDGYRNAALRMAANLPDIRTVLGPWGHGWPDDTPPGPNIGFLPECLHFLRHHLKGELSEREENAPGLIWYQLHGDVTPAPFVKDWPGQWMWLQDPKEVRKRAIVLRASEEGKLSEEASSVASKKWLLPFNMDVGLLAGEWTSMGQPDNPTDQDDLPLFGIPEVSCDVSLASPCSGAHLAARLCDVFPPEPEGPNNAPARLITHGTKNLCTASGSSSGGTVTFPLNALGYTVRRGHRLALSLSPCYWPLVWPPARDPGVTVAGVFIRMPKVPDGAVADGVSLHLEPKYGPPLKKEVLRSPKYERSLHIDLCTNAKTLSVRSDEGRMRLPEQRVELDGMTSEEEYRATGDPLTAECKIERRMAMKKMKVGEKEEEGHTVDVSYSATMTSSEDHFHLFGDLRVQLDGEEFFAKRCNETVRRRLV